jgi:hypothetical protein
MPEELKPAVRSMLAFWAGGAAAPPPAPPVQAGYRSLLAFWAGGAAAPVAVPHGGRPSGRVGGGLLRPIVWYPPRVIEGSGYCVAALCEVRGTGQLIVTGSGRASAAVPTAAGTGRTEDSLRMQIEQDDEEILLFLADL